MARLPNGMDNVRTTNASEEAPFRAEEEHEAIEVLEDGKKLDGVLHEREEPATLGISLNPRTVSGANLDSPALMMVSGEGVEEDEEEERIEMRPYDPPDLRELGVFAGEGLERAKGMPTLKARGTSTVSHTETSNPAIIDLPQSVHGPPLRVQTSNPSTDPLDIIPLSDDHDTPILLDSLPSAAQPTSFQSAAADPPRTRRRIAIVEIPLMPLHRIRQYGSSSRSGQPTLRSRGQNRIQPISVASSSRESSVFSARPIRAAARRGQASRVQSSVRSSRDSEDFGSYDTVDDDDDDDDDEDGDVSEASESDAVVLRRSGRTGKKRSPEVRRSTRVAKRSVSSTADPSLSFQLGHQKKNLDDPHPFFPLSPDLISVCQCSRLRESQPSHLSRKLHFTGPSGRQKCRNDLLFDFSLHREGEWRMTMSLARHMRRRARRMTGITSMLTAVAGRTRGGGRSPTGRP